MPTQILLDNELDRRVAAFEAAWSANRSAEVAHFLPDRESPDYPRILSELIRIDLEFRGARGESPRLESYRTQAADLFDDSEWLGELAFEEYRQRLELGESVDPDDYARRYGVDVSDWPAPADGTKAFRFPDPGTTVGSFRILAELGRGSFGRVFLAEQIDLAGRRVALKISTKFGRAEPETLARLQHTHIVPVYSTQRIGGAQLTVMPFLGATTLADVLVELRSQHHWPESGKALADTVTDRASRTRRPGDAPATESIPRAQPNIPLDQLRKLKYPEAVLWIGWKLAGALAHAHDRGILHRDIKPANVLLTDEGQPMLLDFNLASDAGSSRDRDLGGTPAYMAPEQLAAMRSGTATAVDARADIYSLGFVLAELLVGRSPYDGDGTEPRIRDRNAGVSPSSEAIICKCLARDPADRYSTAGELAEELNRQLTDQPLRVTREPSPEERLGKWRRRHPLLASTGAVSAVALVLVASLAAGIVVRQRHVQSLMDDRNAMQKYRDFQGDVPAAIYRATGSGRDANSRDAAREQVDRLLARYDVFEGDRWRSTAEVARLPELERAELQDQIGELLVLKSHLEPDLAVAIQLNERAAAAFQERGGIPRTVWDDRYRFATKLGQLDAAREFHAKAAAATAQSRDWYFSGLTAHEAGETAEAARLFARAVEHDPKHYWSWLLLGDSWSILGRDDRAEGCFNSCIALRPDLFMAYYNRGLCHHRRKEYADAIADFTKALELDADREKALVARGQAFQESRDYAKAEADYTEVLDRGTTETRIYFLRAAVRKRRGDATGAAKDRAEGMRLAPSDEVSWVARGREKATAGDANGALADFAEALKLNTRSYSALMNTANVLDEQLHREADAIRALDSIVEFYPHLLAARSGRAVLLARQRNRATALADAEYCLKNNPDREVTYQLAGVYALTSKIQPGDATRAIELLRAALNAGFGLDLVPIDPDLEPIQDRDDFRKLVEAARTLQPSKK